jgi:hypothetical protein
MLADRRVQHLQGVWIPGPCQEPLRALMAEVERETHADSTTQDLAAVGSVGHRRATRAYITMRRSDQRRTHAPPTARVSAAGSGGSMRTKPRREKDQEAKPNLVAECIAGRWRRTTFAESSGYGADGGPPASAPSPPRQECGRCPPRTRTTAGRIRRRERDEPAARVARRQHPRAPMTIA